MLLASCGGKPGPTVTVRIVSNPLGNPDSLYKPNSVTIHTGTTVEWVDRDDLEHTVTPGSNYPGWSGGSSILRHGQTYSHTFTRPGVYRYQCMVHPNMLGVVTVVGRR